MSKLINFIYHNAKILFSTWLILILIVSSIPQLPTLKIKTSSSTTIRIDYIIHFLIFFILSNLFIFWMLNKNPKQKFYNWTLFLLAGIAFSFLIETYQYIIPGRIFNIIDFYFNILGIATGITITGFVFNKTKLLQTNLKKRINE